MTDIYGIPPDASTAVEIPARDTLQAWMPWALARQEDRLELDAGTLTFPVQWKRTSQFDWRDDRLPAIIVQSPGLLEDPRKERGRYMATWQLDIVVVTAGADEDTARDKAAVYLAACRGALAQKPTLGGKVSECRWIGKDNHRAGAAPNNLGGQRAVYATSFAVLVRDVLDLNPPGLPDAPPDDPHNPPGLPPLPTEAVIDITSEEQ